MERQKKHYSIDEAKYYERFSSLISKYRESLDSDATKTDMRLLRKSSLLSSLRRKRDYQADKRKYRSILQIPQGGYGKREEKRRFERIDPKEFAGIIGVIINFAQKHPLDKRHPMPFDVAYEELFCKRPRVAFSPVTGWAGYFIKGEAFWGDGKTKTPQEISRMIMRKLYGHKHKYTKCIKVGTFPDGMIWWAFIGEPPV